MNKFYLILLNTIFVTSSLFAEDKKEENNKLKYAAIITAGILSTGTITYIIFQHFKKKHKLTTTEKIIGFVNKEDTDFHELHEITSVVENVEADKNTIEQIEKSVKSKVEKVENAVEEIKHHITESLDLAESIKKDPKFLEHTHPRPTGSPKITPMFEYLDLNLDYQQDPPRKKNNLI